MRPKFLDQPFFSQRAARTYQSRAEYASPVVINTRTPLLLRLLNPTTVVVLIALGAVVFSVINFMKG